RLDDPGNVLNAVAPAIMTSTTAASKNHPNQFSIRSSKEDEAFWGLMQKEKTRTSKSTRN
ncbi:MAG: hypothetical protein WCF23_10450, partial [Candidatus Nitrosopolaris sp.]